MEQLAIEVQCAMDPARIELRLRSQIFLKASKVVFSSQIRAVRPARRWINTTDTIRALGGR
jgi:hypothetical protein